MRLVRVLFQAIFIGELMVGLLVFSQIQQGQAYLEDSIVISEKKAEVWVFAPFSLQTEKGLRNCLSKTFPHLRLTIFTRFREFRNALVQGLPDAILTRPLVLNSFPGLNSTAIFEGSLDGGSWEHFVFIANKSLDASQEFTLGAVDIIGKKETEEWLKRVMPNKTIHLKPVSRLEDLRSLLLFNYVDAILVPVDDVPWFQSRTEKELFIYDASFTVHLPIIVVMPESEMKPHIHPEENCNSQALGIERWTRVYNGDHSDK